MVGVLLGTDVGLPNSNVGDCEGANDGRDDGDKDGFGVGLPAKNVGTTDGGRLGADVGLQVGACEGNPGT